MLIDEMDLLVTRKQTVRGDEAAMHCAVALQLHGASAACQQQSCVWPPVMVGSWLQ